MKPKRTLVWRTGLPGVPPDSVRCTRAVQAELLTFGFLRRLTAIIHWTVRCNTGLSDVPSGATVASATVDSNGRLTQRTVRVESEQRQKAHRTVNSDCLVHHRTVRWPKQSELQLSKPSELDSSPTPTVGLVVGAINTPNHHHSRYPSFQPFAFNTRALDFTPRLKQEIKSSPKSKITPNN
jgi:hypothetical protein